MDRSSAATTTAAPVWPVLFYDFNMPPWGEDGLYRVHLFGWNLWPIKEDEKVVFGCATDELQALGVVRRVHDDGSLSVELLEYLDA